MADNTTLNPGTAGDVIATDEIGGIKHQRVKVEFGVDGSATDVSATNPLPVSTITGQTTVAAGSGVVNATTQRVVLSTDDPAVTSLGVMDDWDEADRAKVNLIVGQAGVAAGSGVVNATTQRVVLATDVGLPAGTSSLGKIRLEDDLFEKEALISPTRQLQVASGIGVAGESINGGTLDTNFWSSTVANSATATQANGAIVLTSGTDAAGSAQIESARIARHISSNENYYRAVHRVDNIGIADNTREWGVRSTDGNDAALFRISGTTFQVLTKAGGSETVVSSGSFNGSASSYVLNTNAHTYQIWFQVSAIRFIIDDVLIHTVAVGSTRITQTTNFKIYFKNINSGNTTSVNLETWAASIVRLGSSVTRPLFYNLANANETKVLKYGAGSLHRIICNDTTAAGTITLYDNTAGSGTKIATIAAADITTGTSIEYGLDFYTGLTYVSADGPGDYTFIYE
jgi:hypothetical protein